MAPQYIAGRIVSQSREYVIRTSRRMNIHFCVEKEGKMFAAKQESRIRIKKRAAGGDEGREQKQQHTL